MVSFYSRSPSGFDVEFGCGGLRIDDATWTVSEITKPSFWGPPAAKRRRDPQPNLTECRSRSFLRWRCRHVRPCYPPNPAALRNTAKRLGPGNGGGVG
jgi:hypothetical protein